MSAVSTAVPSFLPGLALSLQKNVNSLNLSRSFHCSVVKVVLFVVLLSVLRDNFYILPQLSALVNSFFQKNNNFIFENMERRKRDSNPRAGYPTYTLSRGTSSAT